ncbi:hypothetical protein GQF03_16485 [Sneathiella chungangensis]|uniref:SF3 helicase domain-containing protein n=1 Tax=Sneathiella chungangensis TaxID=1418234 RepID=A0A845MNA2_9PROT|nr:DUF5906 domain-containing protein [Sneathiella chungangensis]MZR23934.1 hypothetical protein [Sneathiella chungangensis]
MTDKHAKLIEEYIQQGWQVFPLRPNSKEPTGKWKDQKATLETLPTLFKPDSNIGVALGTASGGLIDLDFDSSEASAIGNILFDMLPGFGRKSSPCSHRIALCDDPGKTTQFGLTPEEAALTGLHGDDKAMILELRSTGGYTMFPGSIHPTGESIEWLSELPKQIPSVKWADMEKKAGICAFLAIVLKKYPAQAGNRDNICLALAGTLLRMGMPPEQVDRLIVFIAESKGDEEAQARLKAESTKGKLDAGEDVTGLPTLCDLLGIAELEPKLQKWLKSTSHRKSPDEMVAELNEKYFVVGNDGGSCRVVFFEKRHFENDQVREIMVYQSFSDFKNFMMNKRVTVGEFESGIPKTVPLGKFWLEHSDRREYDQIDFLPGKTPPPTIFNLWRGFQYPSVQGGWCKMRRHIWTVLADEDSEAFRYIIKWSAWAVQNPDRPAEVALVFKGGKGTGKGTFARWLTDLFGSHGLQIFSSKHVSGRFNAHLRALVLLFADEAVAPQDHDAESVLKGLITEHILPIEAKGRDLIQARNHLHVVMASNNSWVVPASADERRYAVFDVSGKVSGNKDWFKGINDEMRHGGAEAMMHFLQNLDLKKWHPREDIPANSALNGQRIESLKGLDLLWFGYLSTGDVPIGEPCDDGFRIPTREFAKEANTHHPNDTKAGKILKEMGCRQDRNRRPSGWITPSLKEARRIWDSKRFRAEWNADITAWIRDLEPPF